jgi:asparagine synthase (glutamine-hydrolysing)
MSLIFGIINLNDQIVTKEKISRLSSAMEWENFQSQIFIEENIAIGFCHHPNRVSKAGIYKDEQLIVLADIRIYNEEELHKSFDFKSPEEALAKAFYLWKDDCANHINGDFSAMIYERNNQKLYLLRDHIGARPLAYCIEDSTVIFASHEFGIARSGLIRTAVNERKIIDYLFNYKSIYEQTDFNNIKKVLPGHILSSSRNEAVKQYKYWTPELIKKNPSLTFDSAVKSLRKRIITATQNRIVSGNIGLHVSGGIDSCGVASIIADIIHDKNRLKGYSWSPECSEDMGVGVNEKEFIEAFSSDKNISVKYLNTDKNETVKNLISPEFPVMSIEHTVMQMAGKDEIQVMFSGWGGDEFVSLSIRGTANHLFFKFKWIKLLKYAKKIGLKAFIFFTRSEILPLLVPFGLLPAYKIEYTDWNKLYLLRPSFILKHWKTIFFHKRINFFGYGNRTKFMLNLLNHYHIPDRMDYWAIHAERYGFEYMYPLLDKDVLELWFSIPIEFTYQNFESRLLYREAMKGILTEKIRIRKNKEESLRISFTEKERQNGEKYLNNLFLTLQVQDHLPNFRIEAVRKSFEEPFKNDLLKNYRKMNKYTIYLRYVELVRKYLSSSEC